MQGDRGIEVMNGTVWFYVSIGLLFVMFTIMTGSPWGVLLAFAGFQLAEIERGFCDEL